MSNTTVTFVNVIEFEPERQSDVLDVLREGAETVISKRPGFLSLTLLASKDNRRIVNIARWRSAEDVRATQADPAAAEFARRTALIATASPGLFDVVAEYAGESTP